MIPREYIDEVVRRSDITEVVGSYVQLRHRGRTHTGLCPFHSEKTPSFVVYPETQSFYCFGCGAGGDVITFVRKISNLDYVEAVKLLAGRAGMPMPEEDDQAGRLRSRVLAINKEAARFFYEQLNAENDAARTARGYCPTPPSAASAWATRRTISARCAAICAPRATPRRRCWPPACKSAARRATSTTCSGAG